MCCFVQNVKLYEMFCFARSRRLVSRPLYYRGEMISCKMIILFAIMLRYLYASFKCVFILWSIDFVVERLFYFCFTKKSIKKGKCKKVACNAYNIATASISFLLFTISTKLALLYHSLCYFPSVSHKLNIKLW